jgi:hypothetical protein
VLFVPFSSLSSLFWQRVGALGEVLSYPPRQRADSLGGVETRMCTDHLGYTGEFCASCISTGPSTFYRDYLRCRPCRGEAEDRTELSLKILGALILFALIAIAVAFFNENILTNLVGTVICLQQFAVIGRFATSSLPATTSTDSAATFFSILSIFNFEIDFYKPSCSVGRFYFPDIYFGTLVIILIAAVVFVLASLVRSTQCVSGLSLSLISFLSLFSSFVSSFSPFAQWAALTSAIVPSSVALVVAAVVLPPELHRLQALTISTSAFPLVCHSP